MDNRPRSPDAVDMSFAYLGVLLVVLLLVLGQALMTVGAARQQRKR